MSERLAIVIKDEVMGMVFSKLPIFRRSCSLLRLWINDPEQRNRRALKKEWMVM